MKTRWAVRQTMIVLLFIIGALPRAALAEPIVRDVLRDPARQESVPLTALGGLSVVGGVVQEVRRAGPGVSPALVGIDDGFLANGGLLYGEVRPQAIPVPGQAANDRGFDTGPDLFTETIQGALRATRDAFFDGNDSVNFSLAGFEVNVSLRGERRGISVNGVDLLGSNQPVAQLNEWAPSSALVHQSTNIGAEGTPVVRRVAVENGQINFANLRRLIFDPTTIIAVAVLLGIWVVIVVADVSRSRHG